MFQPCKSAHNLLPSRSQLWYAGKASPPVCWRWLQGLSMTLLFCLGYLGIFVEEVVGLNKAGVALVMAVSLWTIYSDSAGGQASEAGAHTHSVPQQLSSFGSFCGRRQRQYACHMPAVHSERT